MSYARFGEGDVYVYHDGKRFNVHLNANEPHLGFSNHWTCLTELGCLRYLLKLRCAGYSIPQDAIDRLKDEIKG